MVFLPLVRHAHPLRGARPPRSGAIREVHHVHLDRRTGWLRGRALRRPACRDDDDLRFPRAEVALRVGSVARHARQHVASGRELEHHLCRVHHLGPADGEPRARRHPRRVERSEERRRIRVGAQAEEDDDVPTLVLHEVEPGPPALHRVRCFDRSRPHGDEQFREPRGGRCRHSRRGALRLRERGMEEHTERGQRENERMHEGSRAPLTRARCPHDVRNRLPPGVRRKGRASVDARPRECSRSPTCHHCGPD